jgi:hypothetical protein
MPIGLIPVSLLQLLHSALVKTTADCIAGLDEVEACK